LLLMLLLLAAAPLLLLLLLSLLETSLAIANQMALAAEFVPVSGIRPCLKPQEPHESNKLSSTARDQSICPWRASQSNQEKWISCRMLARCQSRIEKTRKNDTFPRFRVP